MAHILRRLVSKKKRRFKDEGDDLDLAYIDKNIVAMAWPGEGGEGLYRNPRSQVARLLKRRHKGHYRVYNLCSERTYNHSAFPDGDVREFPCLDHQVPPLSTLLDFCRDAEEYLRADERNTVVVHCKAGKGRTGMFICCLLLRMGLVDDWEHGLTLYGVRRTYDGEGVTIGSQRRWCRYFARVLELQQVPAAPTLHLARATIVGLSSPHLSGLTIEAQQRLSVGLDTRVVFRVVLPPPTVATHTLGACACGARPLPLRTLEGAGWQLMCSHSAVELVFDAAGVGGSAFQGDIKLQVYQGQASNKNSLFWVWLNTYFLPNGDMSLVRSELDKVKSNASERLELKLQWITPSEAQAFELTDPADAPLQPIALEIDKLSDATPLPSIGRPSFGTSASARKLAVAPNPFCSCPDPVWTRLDRSGAGLARFSGPRVRRSLTALETRSCCEICAPDGSAPHRLCQTRSLRPLELCGAMDDSARPDFDRRGSPCKHLLTLLDGAWMGHTRPGSSSGLLGVSSSCTNDQSDGQPDAPLNGLARSQSLFAGSPAAAMAAASPSSPLPSLGHIHRLVNGDSAMSDCSDGPALFQDLVAAAEPLVRDDSPPPPPATCDAGGAAAPAVGAVGGRSAVARRGVRPAARPSPFDEATLPTPHRPAPPQPRPRAADAGRHAPGGRPQGRPAMDRPSTARAALGLDSGAEASSTHTPPLDDDDDDNDAFDVHLPGLPSSNTLTRQGAAAPPAEAANSAELGPLRADPDRRRMSATRGWTPFLHDRSSRSGSSAPPPRGGRHHYHDVVDVVVVADDDEDVEDDNAPLQPDSPCGRDSDEPPPGDAAPAAGTPEARADGSLRAAAEIVAAAPGAIVPREPQRNGVLRSLSLITSAFRRLRPAAAPAPTAPRAAEAATRALAASAKPAPWWAPRRLSSSLGLVRPPRLLEPESVQPTPQAPKPSIALPALTRLLSAATRRPAFSEPIQRHWQRVPSSSEAATPDTQPLAARTVARSDGAQIAALSSSPPLDEFWLNPFDDLQLEAESAPALLSSEAASHLAGELKRADGGRSSPLERVWCTTKPAKKQPSGRAAARSAALSADGPASAPLPAMHTFQPPERVLDAVWQGEWYGPASTRRLS